MPNLVEPQVFETPLDARAPVTEQSDVWTIQRVLEWSVAALRARNFETPRLDAELLLAHCLGRARLHLYTHFDQPLSVEERDPFKTFLRRRLEGEPVAYLIGEKEFMGLKFQVDASVLIPRSETEHLVEYLMMEIKRRTAEGQNPAVLDVGVGSGAIAVSLAAKCGGVSFEAWDISAEALKLAQKNAERHGVADKISFRQVDALADDEWSSVEESIDLLVSNPPYIAHREADGLSKSVRSYEPSLALFADNDGFAFYEKIAAQGLSCLRAKGSVAVEIGSSQGQRVAQVFRDFGYTMVSVLQDYAKLDRVVTALRPAD